jgi:DNA-binding transcriptional regulator/RsmH inhibitor MraZ
MQSLDEGDDLDTEEHYSYEADECDVWDPEVHPSYEPAVKSGFMGYETDSCCGDGSLSIPPRFLDRNPGRFQSVILTMNVERNVLVYPVAEWLTLQRRVFDAWNHPGMRRLRRLIRGRVIRLSLQNNSYLKLPRSLRESADLGRGIVIVGYEDHLEMCSESRWKASELGDDPDLFARDLRRLDRIQAGAYARKEEQAERPEGTPHVLVVSASEQLLSLLRADPEHLRELSAEALEAFVAERLERMGFAVVRIGRDTRSPDGGIDFLVCPKYPTPFPYLLAIQVKSHRGNVHTEARHIRDFAGAIMSQPVRGGVLVTNTDFTADVSWFARHLGHIISLRGFDDLSRWIYDDFAVKEPLRDIPDVLELRPGLVVNMHDELTGRIFVPSSTLSVAQSLKGAIIDPKTSGPWF